MLMSCASQQYNALMFNSFCLLMNAWQRYQCLYGFFMAPRPAGLIIGCYSLSFEVQTQLG